jgi:hypothetical protein
VDIGSHSDIPQSKAQFTIHIFNKLGALVTPALVASPAAGYDSGDIRVSIVMGSVVLISCAIVHISKSE